MRIRVDGKTQHVPRVRTPEEKAAFKDFKKAERKAHRKRVMAKYPPAVRYAKRKFKGGKAKKSGAKLPKLGIQ